MVYLIAQENNESMKIGYTEKSGKVRLKQLESAKRVKLKLLYELEGSMSCEVYLLKKFNHLKIKKDKNREWFHYSQEIIDHFEYCTKPIIPITEFDKPAFNQDELLVYGYLLPIAQSLKTVKITKKIRLDLLEIGVNDINSAINSLYQQREIKYRNGGIMIVDWYKDYCNKLNQNCYI